MDGALQFTLGTEAWRKLEQGLLEAHQAIDPTHTAIAVIQGWIASQGPVFERLRKDTLGRMTSTIIRLGFRETCSQKTMTGWCRESWLHWHSLREKVTQVTRRPR
jgi:hypothetical protein